MLVPEVSKHRRQRFCAPELEGPGEPSTYLGQVQRSWSRNPQRGFLAIRGTLATPLLHHRRHEKPKQPHRVQLHAQCFQKVPFLPSLGQVQHL